VPPEGCVARLSNASHHAEGSVDAAGSPCLCVDRRALDAGDRHLAIPTFAAAHRASTSIRRRTRRCLAHRARHGRRRFPDTARIGSHDLTVRVDNGALEHLAAEAHGVALKADQQDGGAWSVALAASGTSLHDVVLGLRFVNGCTLTVNCLTDHHVAIQPDLTRSTVAFRGLPRTAEALFTVQPGGPDNEPLAFAQGDASGWCRTARRHGACRSSTDGSSRVSIESGFLAPRGCGSFWCPADGTPRLTVSGNAAKWLARASGLVGRHRQAEVEPPDGLPGPHEATVQSGRSAHSESGDRPGRVVVGTEDEE
jgi:hypothetical protein